MIFAKIFDMMDSNQVLVTIESENEDGFPMSVSTSIDGIRIESELVFGSDKRRQEGFEKFDDEYAIRFYEASNDARSEIEYEENEEDWPTFQNLCYLYTISYISFKVEKTVLSREIGHG